MCRSGDRDEGGRVVECFLSFPASFSTCWTTAASTLQGQEACCASHLLARLSGVGMDTQALESRPRHSDTPLYPKATGARSACGGQISVGQNPVGCHESRGE